MAKKHEQLIVHSSPGRSGWYTITDKTIPRKVIIRRKWRVLTDRQYRRRFVKNKRKVHVHSGPEGMNVYNPFEYLDVGGQCGGGGGGPGGGG